MSATVLVFINAKGGSGSTTISLALAEALQRKGSVTLIDGDITGRRSIAVLTDSIRAVDEARQGPNIAVARTASALTVVELTPSFDAGFTIKMQEIEPVAASICDSATHVIL